MSSILNRLPDALRRKPRKESSEPPKLLKLPLADWFSFGGKPVAERTTAKSRGRFVHVVKTEAAKRHPQPQGAQRRKHWEDMERLYGRR